VTHSLGLPHYFLVSLLNDCLGVNCTITVDVAMSDREQRAWFVCEPLQPHILGCRRILTLILKISIADTRIRFKNSGKGEKDIVEWRSWEKKTRQKKTRGS
jgi:hypothetical protein